MSETTEEQKREAPDAMVREAVPPRDETSLQRRFSNDEVADIIRLSLQEQNRRSDDTVDYAELLSIGNEMGLHEAQIDRAVHLLEEEQLTRDKESLLWDRFRMHGKLFIAVNLLCVAINVLVSSSSFWSMYLLFGWGLFLLGHYAGVRYAPQFVEMAMERTRHMASNHYQAYFDDDSNVGFSHTDSMGLAETQGLVSLNKRKLVIEYQTADAMFGVLKAGIKSVEIPLEQLTSVRMEQRLWQADLVIQASNMRVFQSAPGSSGGKLRLKINRQSVRAATALVENIEQALQSPPSAEA